MENDTFQTTDIILAATLNSLQFSVFELTLVEEPNRFAFVFKRDDQLMDIIGQFNKDKILIEPKRFFYHYRAVRRKVFDKLQEKGGIQNEVRS